MKIQINFDSWEELCRFLATANADGLPDNTRDLAGLVEEAKKPNAFEQAKAAVAEIRKEAEAEEPVCDACMIEYPPEEPEQPPFEEAPAPAPEPVKEEPKLSLQDVQKAVREFVKAKGKDAAKAVLGNYGATSASSVRAENYTAVVKDLKEALNG